MELGNSNQNEVNYDVPTNCSVHRTFQWTWSKFSDHKNVIYHFEKKILILWLFHTQKVIILIMKIEAHHIKHTLFMNPKVYVQLNVLEKHFKKLQPNFEMMSLGIVKWQSEIPMCIITPSINLLFLMSANSTHMYGVFF